MVQSLEEELNQRIANHKYNIVTSSLVLFEGNGIYNTHLLQDKYGDDKMSLRGQDRAFRVADELEGSDDQKTYDQIYEMCWQIARHRITNRLYEIDI